MSQTNQEAPEDKGIWIGPKVPKWVAPGLPKKSKKIELLASFAS